MHQVHGSVSDIHNKIHSLKILKVFCNCRIALWHDRTACDFKLVHSLPITDFYIPVFQHISLKFFSLCLYPFQRKSHSKMHAYIISCIRMSPCFQFLHYCRHGKYIIIIICHLVSHKSLVTFPNNIIFPIHLDIILRKNRWFLTSTDCCRENPSCRLIVSVACIYSDNQAPIHLVFSNLICHILFLTFLTFLFL